MPLFVAGLTQFILAPRNFQQEEMLKIFYETGGVLPPDQQCAISSAMGSANIGSGNFGSGFRTSCGIDLNSLDFTIKTGDFKGTVKLNYRLDPLSSTPISYKNFTFRGSYNIDNFSANANYNTTSNSLSTSVNYTNNNSKISVKSSHNFNTGNNSFNVGYNYNSDDVNLKASANYDNGLWAEVALSVTF